MAYAKFLLPALLLSTALAAAVPFPVAAQDAQPGPAHIWHFGAHVEGHIAFLKAELAITPAQEALWDKVAGTIREDVAEFEHFRQPLPVKPPTAVQRLEHRAAVTALRAKGEQRFLEAFRPLYASLSDAQKRTADELIGHEHEPPQ